MYENKKIFILGMARSGYEAAKLLASNNKLLVTDMKEQEKDKVEELESLGVEIVITDAPHEILDDTFDLMIKNPGIKYDHKCVVKAKELGMPVINEVELSYSYIDKDAKIIGITGSNGKTTTTTLIYEIMKEAFGDKVFLAGNIGTPLSHFAKDIKKDNYLVIEISDHQLCDMYNFKTNISIMTNLSDCHTDFHDSHERYVNIKKRVFNNHNSNDIAILNLDNKEVMELTSDIASSKYYFSKSEQANCYYKNEFIYYNDKPIIDTNEIILKGKHNYENIMCAILACKEFNVRDEIIKKVVSNFKGVEHRLEYVTTFNNREFYNDSKSTNVESTIIALDSFNKDTILIMGGLDRGHSFEDLIPHLKNTKLVVAYGETKERIKLFMEEQNIKTIITNTLDEAVIKAYKESKENNVILLSPACASWDQFKDFEARGKLYKDTIENIKKSPLNIYKNIHMIGIGGISMSGIAEILSNWGYNITGSDRTESPISKNLENKGIKVYYPQAKENIKDEVEFVVYTAAIKEDNEELVEAKNRNIPMMERGEFLGEITKLFNNTIGVAGTHGKTSTTSMLSCIFLETSLDPTIQVGSILKNLNGNFKVGNSDNLIIEACEYCDSYLSFKQKSAIILNIDNDHLDYFKNFDNIKESFKKYVNNLPEDGYLIINNDDENTSILRENTKANVITYGINNNSNIMAKNIEFDMNGNASYDLVKDNETLGRITLSVPGMHNVSNSLAAAAMAYVNNIDFEDIKSGLLKYEGAARRLEYIGELNGAKIYDDYAHHPTEVEATSNAVHKMNYNETWIIFEPHTYSRLKSHLKDFAGSLKDFNNIIITDIYAAREQNVYNITENDLINELKKLNKESLYISDYNEIKEYLKNNVNKNDIIITMGAGNVTKLAKVLNDQN